jgi:twinkle protein
MQQDQMESAFLEHQACPCGVSSDALAVYDDGHSHCFSCGKTFQKDGANSSPVKTNPLLIADGEIRSLRKRGISEATCRKYGYAQSIYSGQSVQVAPYYSNGGKMIAQKVRFPPKDDDAKPMISLGDLRSAMLFGQQLFKDDGKRIVVTEGEIDALSVYEAMPGWPAVSIKTGANGAVNSVKQNIQFLEGYKRVIFMFDMDTPGQEAAKKCADLLTPGKAAIANLPLKDANEMVQAGRIKEIAKAIFEAKDSRPDGIVNGRDVWHEATKPIEMGTPYPFVGLNDKSYGLRREELVTICAGSGTGKSQFVSEIAYDLAVNKKQNVGYIALEESVGRTARRFMGINLSLPIHLPTQEVEADKLREAFEATLGTGRLWLYDHWGSLDSENLLSKMRYLVKACDCQWLILDHLSIVISGLDLDGDERRMLDKTMTMLRSFVEETGCGMLIVSHLRRPPNGKSHEEGLMPSLTDLRSSHSIAQLSDIVLALGRNSQSDDDTERNTTEVRILKNRFSGETGSACFLKYEGDTGRMTETTNEFESEF